MQFISAIGQDSHRFLEGSIEKPAVFGGFKVPGCPGFEANSDGDVILHALTNAISGITGRNILGEVADKMCRSGVTDSREYLRVALEDLDWLGYCPAHVSITMECSRPKMSPWVNAIKASVASLLNLEIQGVGLTCTSGEGLTDFGRGLGVMCFAILNVQKKS